MLDIVQQYINTLVHFNWQNLFTQDFSLVIFLTWMIVPFYFFVTLVAGLIKQSLRHIGDRDDLLIVQIPTIGNTTVNHIVWRLRQYDIKNVLYWLIIEEWDDENKYKGFDKVIKVPSSFTTRCKYKARALEYARRVRLEMINRGELPREYKVLQCDDDSVPSKELMIEAKNTPYDVLIATIKPNYSKGSILARIADYERPFACSCTCSFFTSIKKPVWAHGEALVFNHKVDRLISLDIPCVMASEDMIFTHLASYHNIKMTNTPNTVSIIPPLRFSDLVRQRKRWIWGHINAIRFVLPLGSKIRLIYANMIGLVGYGLATVFIPLVTFNIVQLTPEQHLLTTISLGIWFLTRFIAVSKVSGVKHGLIATALSYIIVTINFIVHVRGLLSKPPQRFEVIEKTI